jgi:hypothetical protein
MKNIILSCLFVFSFVVSSITTFGQKLALGGEWDTDDNWAPTGIPVPSDLITIPDGVTMTITLDAID